MKCIPLCKTRNICSISQVCFQVLSGSRDVISFFMGVNKDEKYIGHEIFPNSMNLAELKNI